MKQEATARVASLVRRVLDRKRLETYRAAVGPTFEATGARPISVYRPFEQAEETDPVEGAVLVKFPSLEATRTLTYPLVSSAANAPLNWLAADGAWAKRSSNGLNLCPGMVGIRS